MHLAWCGWGLLSAQANSSLPTPTRWPGFQTALLGAVLVPWKAIALLLLSRSVMSNFCDLKDYIARQAPLSMGFSSPEYWSGLPFPSPGNLSNQGIESTSPPLQLDSLLLSHQEFSTPALSVFWVSKSFAVGSVLCTAGCLAASLASTLSVHSLKTVPAENGSRDYHMSSGGGNAQIEKHFSEVLSSCKRCEFRTQYYSLIWTKPLHTTVISSVQFSRSVVSDSLQPHGPQHTRPPNPSPPTPGVYSNSCPSSRWYHPTISSSIIPFSSHLQSFPASGSFPVSQFFASGGQSIGASATASVLPVTIQDWFPLPQ